MVFECISRETRWKNFFFQRNQKKKKKNKKKKKKKTIKKEVRRSKEVILNLINNIFIYEKPSNNKMDIDIAKIFEEESETISSTSSDNSKSNTLQMNTQQNVTSSGKLFNNRKEYLNYYLIYLINHYDFFPCYTIL